MKEIIKHSNQISSSNNKIIHQNKEWPFVGYYNEVDNLRKYLGQELEIHTLAMSGVNRRKYIPMGFFEINPEYIHPTHGKALYPHSLVLNDGSAINLNQVIFANLESEVEQFWNDLDPFMFALNPKRKILELFSSPNIIYKNLELFKKCVYASRQSQDTISQMTKEAFEMGIFDNY